MLYSKEEILKAAEIGEVSMIDARHIVSLLFEARLHLLGRSDEICKCMCCEETIKTSQALVFCDCCYEMKTGK